MHNYDSRSDCRCNQLPEPVNRCLTWIAESVLMCVGPRVCKRQKEQLTIMTKAELLEAVAKRAGLTKTDADWVLDAFSMRTLGRQWP